MKYLIGVVMLASATGVASAQYVMQPSLGGTPSYGTGSNPDSQDVRPYTRKGGVHHSGHYQTKPGDTQPDDSHNRRSEQSGPRPPRR
ncbi:MAG TPA: hypothetical protein VJR71_11235 [Pseudolabrys sp.]|nr:hypothetical protein [Pseudolabrys sp.]